MRPKAILLDCAETLISVQWEPGSVVERCAEAMGLSLPDGAADTYRRIVRTRWAEYSARNATRDWEHADRFWSEVGAQWLERIRLDVGLLAEFRAKSDELLFGKGETFFAVFPDVPGALAEWRAAGIRLAVVSNWDYTLTRVLDRHGLLPHFEVVLASMVEGVEKPDPELFRIALRALDLGPAEVLHVGDNPVDDLAGASAAGIAAVLIDREGSHPELDAIRSLDELTERLCRT